MSGRAVKTALAIAAVGVPSLLFAARRGFTVIIVAGRSMNPTYDDGERLLVRRGSRRAARGSVVVFRTPDQIGARDVSWLVKRVVAVPGDPVPPDVRPVTGGTDVVPRGRLVVRGDNPHSVDSRRFGFVPVADVLGVAARRRDHLDV